jgi:hypothetical protein
MAARLGVRFWLVKGSRQGSDIDLCISYSAGPSRLFLPKVLTAACGVLTVLCHTRAE